jgi:hypothetical protein
MLKKAEQDVLDNIAARDKATASPYYNGSRPISSPTVVSDANIRESVIPDLKSKAAKILDPRIISTPGSTLVVDPNTPGYSKSAVDRYLAQNGTAGAYEDIYRGMSSEEDTNNDISTDPNYRASIDILDQAKSLNDSVYNSTIDSIKARYKTLSDKLVASQDSQTGAIQSALTLGGTNRYAPVSASGIMSAKNKYDIESLAALQAEETSLVNQAQAAREAKDYQLLEERLRLVEDKRKEKNALATKVNEQLIAQNKVIREKEIQSSRDSAIASLLSQGITDPSQMLNYLNFDEAGNQTGDFTADEIAKTLKAISPGDDLSKLSGTTRDFFILKGTGQLPSNISSLPEDQQMMAYLSMQKKSTASTAAGASKNKITLSEAKSKGLPLSTVGMSEEDIADSFQDSEPPYWFIEKLNSEKGMTVLPEIAKQTWEAYRSAFVNSPAAKEKTPPAKVIGDVRALRSKGGSEEEIRDFILFSGYNPENPAFNE